MCAFQYFGYFIVAWEIISTALALFLFSMLMLAGLERSVE
jgi:hypothetical protein